MLLPAAAAVTILWLWNMKVIPKVMMWKWKTFLWMILAMVLQCQKLNLCTQIQTTVLLTYNKQKMGENENFRSTTNHLIRDTYKSRWWWQWEQFPKVQITMPFSRGLCPRRLNWISKLYMCRRSAYVMNYFEKMTHLHYLFSNITCFYCSKFRKN